MSLSAARLPFSFHRDELASVRCNGPVADIPATDVRHFTYGQVILSGREVAASEYFAPIPSREHIHQSTFTSPFSEVYMLRFRDRVGPENVIATDVRSMDAIDAHGAFRYCDVTDRDAITRLVVENSITHVMHLATLLSAVGERNPQLALRVNMLGIQNVLEIAAQHRLSVRPALLTTLHVSRQLSSTDAFPRLKESCCSLQSDI
jgi:hypothetical protein